MSKLAKLKSAMKNLGRSRTSPLLTSSATTGAKKLDQKVDLCTVLVGKSRRRYLLSSQLLQHPLIRQLLHEDDGVLLVCCEVVMFEHFLWMLENSESQLASCCMDELLDLYSY